jgi:amino acid transporter
VENRGWKLHLRDPLSSIFYPQFSPKCGMADWNWFYTQHGQRMGPVTLEQLQWMIGDGQVQHNDLAWTDGMAQWTHVHELPELQPHIPIAANTATTSDTTIPTAALAQPVTYFTPVIALPPRAEANLAGHARPTADVSEWPLNDEYMGQLQRAVTIRRAITWAAGVYWLIFVLSAVGGVGMLIAAVAVFPDTQRYKNAWLGFIIFAILTGGFAILHFFAWRGTLRSQRWAPILMFIFSLIGVLLNLIGLVAALTHAPAAAITAFFGVLITGGVAAISMRAFVAIPKYLSQPAWCQELLAKAR